MTYLRQLKFIFVLTAGLVLQACSGSSGDSESGNARIRLLNASIGYESVDLYVSTDDDEEDSLEIESVSYGAVSDYVVLKSDTYTFKVKRADGTSSLYTMSDVNLTDGSHTTLVAWGQSGELIVNSIDEDLGEPDPDSSKVSLMNASGAGSVDIYVTSESEELEDASPMSQSVTTTLDSDTYRLRVTGADDTDDMRLDVSDLILESEGVATVILTGTSGGVLVNAFFLPQQGELQKYLNVNARIRGAVALGSGSAATLEVSNVRLLTNAAAGVIGNRYWEVEAGSAPVELTVNGGPVSVANLNLVAGGDYTLLVLDDAGMVAASLLVDDNYPPDTSGRAKLRLLHGIAGYESPITLTVDFFPVLEGYLHGEVSEYVEIDAGLEYQYDVSNADTTDVIWTRDTVSLQADSVYTLLMSGTESAVNGSLRRDR